MERLVDPAIADLQSEYAETLQRGHVWRSRWVRVVGSIAFWKVIGVHAIDRAVPVAREVAATDDGALRRTFRFSAAWTAIAIAPLVWVPLHQFIRRVTPAEAARLTLYLIPQAVTVVVPLALALGTLCGLRGRSVSIGTQRWLVAAAAIVSVGMFIVLGWILPDANQAFRVLIHHGPLPLGMNELTLPELAASGYWFQFNTRCSLSAASVVLAVFASTASRRMRGNWLSIAVGMIAVSVYVSLFLTLQGPRARPLDAWTPNLILTALTVLTVRLTAFARAATSSPR
jgi:hypothetical protein